MPDLECTAWPDVWFGVSITDCCVAHDLGGTDWALAQCVAGKGDGFWLLGLIMLIGLSTLGVIYRAIRKHK